MMPKTPVRTLWEIHSSRAPVGTDKDEAQLFFYKGAQFAAAHGPCSTDLTTTKVNELWANFCHQLPTATPFDAAMTKQIRESQGCAWAFKTAAISIMVMTTELSAQASSPYSLSRGLIKLRRLVDTEVNAFIQAAATDTDTVH